MRVAVIKDNVVVDVIMANEEFTLDGYLLVPSETAGPGWTFHPGINTFSPPAVLLDDLKAAKLGAINLLAESKHAAGAPYPVGEDTLHADLSDRSLAVITAMGATAGLATLSVLPWPEDYQRGFIAIENVRIPLPTPADGLAFAGYVGTYFAALAQNGRDLKDAVLAAEDEAAIDAIDIETGWPG